MPVNGGNFGEWVKRQMNYQNKTKKTKTKNKENQTTSHVHSKNSSVSPAGRIISSKQDFNRTYGFTITSIHQLSCSNKYSSLPIDLHFLIHFKQYRKNSYQSKTGYKKNTKYFLFKNHFCELRTTKITLRGRSHPTTYSLPTWKKMNSEFCTR